MRNLFITLLILVVATSCDTKKYSLRPATTEELSLVFQAMVVDDIDSLNKLAEDGFNFDTPIPDGKTPLSGAAAAGKEKALVFLIEQGCSVTSADKRGMTPLHYASLYGRTNTITVLIANGAEINATEVSGLTPLHCAAMGDAPTKTCTLLIANGADIYAKDGFGADPVTTAELNQQTNTAILIRNHMK